MLYPKPCYNEPCYKEVVVYEEKSLLTRLYRYEGWSVPNIWDQTPMCRFVCGIANIKSKEDPDVAAYMLRHSSVLPVYKWHNDSFPIIVITLNNYLWFFLLYLLNLLEVFEQIAWVNNVNLDRMLQNAASDQDLHCLLLIQQCFNTSTFENKNIADMTWYLPLQGNKTCRQTWR